MKEKRVPPWERAQLNFKLAERKRNRELEEKERPARARLSDLDENRNRLARIRKNICPDCQKYIFRDELAEGEKKIGVQLGFCKCNGDPVK